MAAFTCASPTARLGTRPRPSSARRRLRRSAPRAHRSLPGPAGRRAHALGPSAARPHAGGHRPAGRVRREHRRGRLAEMARRNIENVYGLRHAAGHAVPRVACRRCAFGARRRLRCPGRMTPRGRPGRGGVSGRMEAVVDRHAILRTTFAWEQLAHPMQVVWKRVSFVVARIDLGTMPQDDQHAQVARIAEDLRRGFDLRRAPLMRCALIRCSDTRHRVLGAFTTRSSTAGRTRSFDREVFALQGARAGQRATPRPRASLRRLHRLARETGPGARQRFWSSTFAASPRPRRSALTTHPLATTTASRSCARRFSAGRRRSPRDLHASAPAHHEHADARRLCVAPRALQRRGRRALRLHRLGTIGSAAWHRRHGGGLHQHSPRARAGLAGAGGCPVASGFAGATACAPRLRAHSASRGAGPERRAAWNAAAGEPPGFENYPAARDLGQEGPRTVTVVDAHMVERSNYPLTVQAAFGGTLALKVGYACRRLDGAAAERLMGHLRVLLGGPRRRCSSSGG